MKSSEIGEQLRLRREQLGLTLQDAQAATKVRRRYLEALETGDWSIMPGEVYARGFLRAYASFLGLDGEELIKSYQQAEEGSTSGPSRRSQERRRNREAARSPRARRRPRIRRKPTRPIGPPRPLARPRSGIGRTVGSLILLILLVIGSFLAITRLFDAARDGLLPFLDRRVEDQGPDGEETGGHPHGEPDPEPPAPEPEPEPEPAVQVDMADSGSGPIVYTVTDSAIEVVFRVTARSWAEVRVEGNTVFEGFFEEGETMTYRGEEVWARIGNPPGVQVTVNGIDMGVPAPVGPRNLQFVPAANPSGT